METVNIWSHLLGSLAFVATGIALLKIATISTTVGVSAGDRFAFATSVVGSAVCFGLSAAFHTLRSHSFNVHHFSGKLDILGICFLAIGGGTSATYYAFFCHRKVQLVYWILNFTAGVAAAITLFDTGGGGSKMRTLRGTVFSLLAISAMLPILHRTGVLGWSEGCRQIGTQWYLAEGLSLLLGVSLFVGRFPERWSPGSFDIWGHSHQLFHIWTLGGTAFHIMALVTSYNYRQAYPSCT
jgi:adiponectin receptor